MKKWIAISTLLLIAWPSQAQNGFIFWCPGFQIDPATASVLVTPYPVLGTVRYSWELNGGLHLIDTDAGNHDGKLRLGWGTRLLRHTHITRGISAEHGLGWQRSKTAFALNDTTYKVRTDWLEIPAGMTFRWRQLGYFTPYFQPQFILAFKLVEEFRREASHQIDILLRYEDAWAGVRVDIRLAAGCEYELGPKWSAFAQLQWRRSLTNIVHPESVLNIENEENFYFSQANIAAGFIFTP